MGRFAVVCSVLAMAVAACFFEPTKPAQHGGGSDAGVDAVSDTPTMCATASTECVGDVLRTCTTVGQPGMDKVCSWGCSTTGSAHCAVMQPAGGGLQASDLTSAFPSGGVTLTDGAVVDTTNCTITGATGNFTCNNAITVAVFRAQQISINGHVRVIGSLPAAFVSDDDLMVMGTLDATGGCAGTAAGPGGHDGSPATVLPMGHGAGQSSASSGGGGGANAAGGGSGGEKNSSSGYGAGGVAFGDAVISRLEGGGGGAGAGAAGGGSGGGGGGAVQLVSNHQILVSGAINAGGCGGWGTAASAPAGGGGAGGTILLEAQRITISGTLAANGGGGGAGDPNGSRGGDGSASGTAALGGTTSDSTTGIGGAGGAGASPAGQTGGNAVNSGGGGGAAGWIRLNTRNSQLDITTATLSPTLGTAASAGSAAAQ